MMRPSPRGARVHGDLVKDEGRTRMAVVVIGVDRLFISKRIHSIVSCEVGIAIHEYHA